MPTHCYGRRALLDVQIKMHSRRVFESCVFSKSTYHFDVSSQDVQVKHSRFMTEEFKNANAILFEGRLVCRHFLRGRCTKVGFFKITNFKCYVSLGANTAFIPLCFQADDCQLEHIQVCNDIIKEACKFYIQGFCTKGESCPYMHNIL